MVSDRWMISCRQGCHTLECQNASIGDIAWSRSLTHTFIFPHKINVSPSNEGLCTGIHLQATEGLCQYEEFPENLEVCHVAINGRQSGEWWWNHDQE